MSITLYHYHISTPSRTALLTARALRLDVDVKVVNLKEKEQFREEFVALNPQHCVPTLVDNGFMMTESQAIACYLANKYSKNDHFYPKNLEKRAVVDRLMYFAAGTLFQEVRFKGMPFLLAKKNQDFLEEEIPSVHKALSYLNTLLNGQAFLTGSEYTVADIVLVTTVSSFVEVGLDLKRYQNIQKWLENCAIEIPGYEENKQGAKDLAELLLKH